MDVINVGRLDHLSSAEVRAMVADRYGRTEISDACAVTIASWWQSPAGRDMPFTALSTAGSVDYRELADSIYLVRSRVDVTADRRALDMLSTWALAKVTGRI